MASPRSDSPAEIDFSVIRTAIQMNHKMLDQILHGIHYGSDEVRNLLREECDFIVECKVCRNLFRSFPNFVAHKRVYCTETFEEKLENDNFIPNVSSSETVIVQPEDPVSTSAKTGENTSKTITEAVIERTFDGKSKDYQLYTKVAEDIEKQKVVKSTKTVLLTKIPSNPNAVIVTHHDGEVSEALLKEHAEKQAQELAKKGPKKKSTLADVCADLVRKGQARQNDSQMSPTRNEAAAKQVTRSRKSSPRKSVEYITDLEMGKKTGQKNKGIKGSEVVEDSKKPAVSSEDSSSADDKEWMKYCNIQKLVCSKCNRHFSSLYNLKTHAKMKHVNAGAQFKCQHCSMAFDFSSTLDRHLKNVHQLPENVNTEQHKSSPEKMEVSQEAVESRISSGKFLPYSTGWKKCDKCGQVFWKAKSYYRHHGSCKGTRENKNKSPQKSAIKAVSATTQVPTGTVETIVVGPQGKILMRCPNKELMKLQEKLRAKALTPGLPGKGTSVDDMEKSAEQNPSIQKKDESVIGHTSTVLYKALTEPLKSNTLAKDKDSSTVESSAAKSGTDVRYKLRQFKEKDGESDVRGADSGNTDGRTGLGVEVGDHGASSKNNNEIKKLEEKLSRQAGLKDGDTHVSTVYSLRQTPQSKPADNGTRDSRTTASKEKCANVSSETVILLKEQNRKSGTPEIQELQEKLAREALGHSPEIVKVELKERDTRKGNIEKVKDTSLNETTGVSVTAPVVQSGMERRSRSTEKLKITKQVEAVRSSRQLNRDDDVKPVQEIQTANKDELRLQQEIESTKNQGAKRHFRSVSQGCESSGRFGEKTPEKLSLPSSDASPVIARRQSFPTSPTPSLNSNSGDGYNLKFKMTVQEMAELVESASLTKFAKERKKRAKNFLTKKQAKDSQKIAPVLSKPMKRRSRQKKKIVARNVYGTRKSGTERKGLGLVAAADAKAKRLSLEQKRLQNSAGFVEEKFYASSAGSKETGRKKEIEKDTGLKETHKKDLEKDAGKTTLPLEVRKLQNSAGLVEENLYASSAKVSADNNTNVDQKVKRVGMGPGKSALPRDGSGEGRKAREMKKLANSAGFVEEKYYTSSSWDSSRERFSDAGTGGNSKVIAKAAASNRSASDIIKDEDEVSEPGRLSRHRLRQVAPLKGEVEIKLRGSDSSSESKERQNVKTKEAVVRGVDSTGKSKTVIDADVNVVQDSLSGKTATTREMSDENVPKAGDSDGKHRTRLSTGSIYFDSELLRLSPTKIERKIAAEVAKKGKDTMKETPAKLLACKKLNLSPRGMKMEARKSKATFYPLSTGIKQCLKCQKKFWKKKSFDYHMLHVCKDKGQKKTGKKRVLSLSPKNSTPEQMIDTDQDESSNKKVKLESDSINDIEQTVPETHDIATAEVTPVETRSKQTRARNKTSSDAVQDKNAKADDTNKEDCSKTVPDEAQSSAKDADLPIFPGAFKVAPSPKKDTTRSASEEQFQSSPEKLQSNSETIQKKNSPKGGGAKLHSAIDIVKEEAQTEESGSEISGDAQAVGGQSVESCKDKSESVTEGNMIETKEAETNDVSGDGEKVNGGKEAMPEEMVTAGTSGLKSSQCVKEGDSDDNGSDFSGFSEEDLRVTEEELSAHLHQNSADADQSHEVAFEDAELSDLGDLDLSSEDDLETDEEVRVSTDSTRSGEETKAKRPVRKSAQNRFGHMEEIWVYKEPGKPVERVKSQTHVNTREYVLDVDNPTKLHCHNSRDVDRLIDEKNLKCKQCDTPCMSISNLRRHVISHLGWKRYKCRLCTYTCYDKSRCSRHCRITHDEKLTSANFNQLVQDLKKEATKIRSNKRTNTIRSTKIQSANYDLYQKPKSVFVTRTSGQSSKMGTADPSSSSNIVKDGLKEQGNLLSKARMGLTKALKEK